MGGWRHRVKGKKGKFTHHRDVEFAGLLGATQRQGGQGFSGAGEERLGILGH